jgi:hypothetical protein
MSGLGSKAAAPSGALRLFPDFAALLHRKKGIFAEVLL